MSRFSKQVDLLVTSLTLMCVGLLFLFLNQGLNTYLLLHFSLLMIFQSLLLLIMAALAYVGGTKLLTPDNVLLYELIWMVPGLLITEWARTV